jgi:hypothetical protein
MILSLYIGYQTKHVRTRTCLSQYIKNNAKKKPAEAGPCYFLLRGITTLS